MYNRFFLSLSIMFFLTQVTFSADRGLDLIIKNLAKDEYMVAGKQYALFVAVNKYTEWMALKNPVKDAKEIKEILKNRYYIDEFVEVYDEEATKAGINKAFVNLIENTKPEDSVFIFYAGHGHMDEMSDTAFWIPVDGGLDSLAQENWIPSGQIRGFISKMKAQRIALFVDSCFSGDILNPTRSITPSIDSTYFKNAYTRISRQVLTSGASETVPDASEFARQLKMVLEGNNQPYLDPLMIYSKVRLGLTKTTPLFGNLTGTGHQDGGSFLFFLKQKPDTAIAEKSGPKILEQLNPSESEIQKKDNNNSIEKNPDTPLTINEDLLFKEYNTKLKTHKTLTVAGLSSLGAGIISAGIIIFSLIAGTSSMEEYKTATTSEAAVAARQKTEMYNNLFIAGASVGGATLGAGTLMLSLRPNVNKLKSKIDNSIRNDHLQELKNENK